ncbi:HNH endonuclease [Segniliparus rotundus DSM 44985]|uniref:HNH endonuclease n=1 Tax=Segniliparus rotundus (strain ATCC BAA-972 / CDC 1076 / CIP 108378 / DSM 44985 / JCM 13578) TaxID=640132 RepID=D6Z9D8_SEGRD|nr:HNH endonuclease signature motif containing protein [Segniliparus rotundus]ADG98568.1 HNH endonuclease [Segniliparus rotundus DSM 44985]
MWGAPRRVPRSRTPERVRQLVVKRDQARCAWCGAPYAQVDHIVPVAFGGPEQDPDNMQCLCDVCHGAKSAREARAGRERTSKAKANSHPGLIAKGGA